MLKNIKINQNNSYNVVSILSSKKFNTQLNNLIIASNILLEQGKTLSNEDKDKARYLRKLLRNNEDILADIETANYNRIKTINKKVKNGNTK